MYKPDPMPFSLHVCISNIVLLPHIPHLYTCRRYIGHTWCPAELYQRVCRRRNCWPHDRSVCTGHLAVLEKKSSHHYLADFVFNFVFLVRLPACWLFCYIYCRYFSCMNQIFMSNIIE